MPIYEYECQKCKTQVEAFQKMSDKPLTKCSKCGGRLEKLTSASAIQFKGSGWYVTDYAGKDKKAAEKSEKAQSEATVSSDSKSDKSEKKKESSPAKKTSEKASTTKVPSGD
jgi:putative FmdB family regulatory protein